MPRHSFKDTCDIFAGPDAPTPGALMFTGPCRLVTADGIATVGVNAPPDVAWLTEQSYDAQGPWDSVVRRYDAGVADQVAVPSGSPPRFWVTQSERINWKGQPIYRRVQLADLPFPTFTSVNVGDIQTCNFFHLSFAGIMVNTGNWSRISLGMQIIGQGFVVPTTIVTFDFMTGICSFSQQWQYTDGNFGCVVSN